MTASDGQQALEMVEREHPDLVLMDVLMPKLSGYDVCERIKQNKATRLTPVVLITALHESGHKIRGINAGADDFLTKPVNAHELKARVRSLVRLKRHTDDLDSAESVILSLALVIEARDAYTDGHCQRLAGYATALGTAIGLGDDQLAALYRGGYLHDVGEDWHSRCRAAENRSVDADRVRANQTASHHRRPSVRRDALASAGAADRPPSS